MSRVRPPNPEWLTSKVLEAFPAWPEFEVVGSIRRGITSDCSRSRSRHLRGARLRPDADPRGRIQDAGCNNDDVLNHCRDATARTSAGAGWSIWCWARSEAMTESQWLKCKDPEEAVHAGRSHQADRPAGVSLFAAGFWRWQEARLKPGDRGVLAERLPKLEQWAETGKAPKGVLPNKGQPCRSSSRERERQPRTRSTSPANGARRT